MISPVWDSFFGCYSPHTFMQLPSSFVGAAEAVGEFSLNNLRALHKLGVLWNLSLAN